MRYVVTNEQMKAAEKKCDKQFISYSEMMFNAGKACAERIREICDPCRAVILCGNGNNGGDGFVIAKLLYEYGFKVRVILVNGNPRTECAKKYYKDLPHGMVITPNEEERCERFIATADIAVDCIFGTGFHGMLPNDILWIIDEAYDLSIRFSVDVPSGVNSDTGEFDEKCFHPTHTFVLDALKKGFLVPECREILGKVEILDIGIDKDYCYNEYEAILTEDFWLHPFDGRPVTSNKGTFGKLLNISGALRYCGAAAMSTRAALRSGCGLTTLAAPVSVVKALAGSIHETTYLPLPETSDGFIGENACDIITEALPKATAVLVGCGLGNSENTRKVTEYVIKNASCPLIIDADGINSIAANINVLKERTGDTVITPHPLEFSRISGLFVDEIQRDRIGSARRFADEYGVIVVLKGANTVIAEPDHAYVNTTGNSALAKGGSGDVLAGMIASIAAQGRPASIAAIGAVYCHGCAADLAVETMHPASVLASDIIELLPKVYK